MTQKSEVIARVKELAPELTNPNEKLIRELMPSDVALRPCPVDLVNLMCVTTPEKVNLTSYNSAVAEWMKMHNELTEIPHNREDFVNTTKSRLVENTKGIEPHRLESLVRSTPIHEDLPWLAEEVVALGNGLDQVNERAEWFLDPLNGQAFKCIGVKEMELMRMYRLLGLVSFESLRRLRDTRVVVAGASAAARTLDLVVALGAKHLTVIDNGRTDAVKANLLPGFAGSVQAFGMYKTTALLAQLQSRNPRGNFDFRVGLLQPDGMAKEGDMEFKEFAASGDLFMTVIDWVWYQSEVREYMAKLQPEAKIAFLADLGNVPPVWLERVGDLKHYNREFAAEEWERMRKLPGGIVPGSTEFMREALGIIWRMTESDQPPEHALQLIFTALGITKGWSQSVIAGAEAAVVMSKTILSHLGGKEVVGHKFNATTVNSMLVPEIPDEDKVTLEEVQKQIYAWKE